MKVNFKLVGVDCAVCASKLEGAIKKLSYVKEASLNFVDLKLYVETADDFDKTEQELEDMLQSITSKVLPNVTIKNLKKQKYLDSLKSRSKNKQFRDSQITTQVATHVHISDEEIEKALINDKVNNLPDKEYEKVENRVKRHKINWFSFDFIKVYIATILFILGLTLPVSFWYKFAIYLVAFIIVGYDVVFSAIKNLFKGKFLDEKFLTSIASISAFCIKEMPEAVAVMLLYQVGELFQSNAVEKSRNAIGNIVNLKSEYANLVVDGEISKVKPEELKLNDIILIKVGERVPTDVSVVKFETNLDVSSITGESLPKYVKTKDIVYSGSINLTNAIYAKVESTYENSTVAKILDLIENNSIKKSKAENFITKFAKYYTPIVVGIALILFIISLCLGDVLGGIHRAAVFLVISCPCALVISIPLTYYCGLGVSAKYGLLIKGANVLDNINNLKAICFDKTGTITKGEFKITEVSTSDEKRMLKYLVYAESISNHPISRCIVGNNIVDSSQISDSKEIIGQGVVATVSGHKVVCGNEKLMQNQKIDYNAQTCSGTIIYVAVDNEYLGYVVISDTIKDDSKNAISSLKEKGIKTIMLTGDNQVTAEYVSYEVGVDDYKYNLLPQDKVSEFEKIKNTYKSVGFVGDGINDSPVLDISNVGYAMGIKGSDSAIEYSDVVIMTDNLQSINDSIKIASKTKKIAIENIVFSLAVKVAVMILGVLNMAPMYLAIFTDVGVSILAILNAIRMFLVKPNLKKSKKISRKKTKNNLSKV